MKRKIYQDVRAWRYYTDVPSGILLLHPEKKRKDFLLHCWLVQSKQNTLAVSSALARDREKLRRELATA